VKDIHGARTKEAYVRTRQQYDSLNYDDVTKPRFQTTRSVNPLFPSYLIRDDQGKVVTIGAVEGSSPRRQIERKDNLDGCLNVRDIRGTAAGTKTLGAFHSTQRRQFLNPNDLSDIEGTKVNTLKKGVQTTRVCNPLDPKY